MIRTRHFTFMDGRDVQAGSATEFFERLRQTEYLPPADLGRYLDLLHSRGVLAFGVSVDVGTPGRDDIRRRCEKAMASLINHGWVRVAGRTATLVGRGPARPNA